MLRLHILMAVIIIVNIIEYRKRPHDKKEKNEH